MARNNLNLAGLRTSPRASNPTAEGAGGPELSRRTFLAAAGATALAAGNVGPALQRLGSAFTGEPVVSRQGGRIVLLIGGEERWVIDPARFGGSPRTSLEQSEGLIRMQLDGALFPGTSLPADLASELSRTRSGWRIRFRMLRGAFTADAPLKAWLGGEPATARASADGLATGLGTQGELRLSGRPRIAFGPNWQLTLAGPGVARLVTPQITESADLITVGLAGPDEPSLMQHPAANRTRLTLHRQGRAWSLWPGLLLTGDKKLTASANPFDRIVIETMESRSGGIRQALAAETAATATGAAGNATAAAPEEPVLAFLPGNDLTDLNGNPFQLALRAPRYAIAFDAEGDQSALLARFSLMPAWLHYGGFSVQVGDSPTALPFELINRGGKTERCICSPTVHTIAAPMAGAIVEPLPGGPDDVIAFADELSDTAAVAAAGPSTDAAPPIIGPTLPIKVPPIGIVARAAWISVVRPSDMLALEFRFINLSLKTSARGTSVLERTTAGKTAYIVVRFPPQAIAEESFPDYSAPNKPPDPGPAAAQLPIKSRAAGESWLAFKLPPAIASVPYTVDGLLAWQDWEQVITATPTNPVGKAESEQPISSIEAPYRVYLSPGFNTTWQHSSEPVTHNERTELWHTRLAKKENSGMLDPGPIPVVRVTWTPDKDVTDNNGESTLNLKPFRNTLTRRNRADLLTLTSVLTTQGSAPVTARKLMLTSLGAWLDLEGHWNAADDIALMAWKHRATQGRDQFVQVVLKGYLYPFGHKVALMVETERRIEDVPGAGYKSANMRQITYIVVTQPERVYPDPGADPTQNVPENMRARKMPFRRVTITDHATPKLRNVTETECDPGMGQEAFWPKVGDNIFEFHAIGVDWQGKRVEMTLPLIFVLSTTIGDGAKMGKVYASYQAWSDRRRRPMNGQMVAYAEKAAIPNPSPDDQPGDTAFETQALTFASEYLLDGEEATPPFFPIMESADVRIPTLYQMTGSTGPQNIQLHNHWLQYGFSQEFNKGMLFAKLPKVPSISFGGDKSGGVMTPDLPLGGLSLSHGLLGGSDDDGNGVGGSLAKFAGLGEFKPEYFFDKAKVLGGILLSAIIDQVNDATGSGDKKKVPKITSKVLYKNDEPNGVPRAIQTNLDWEPSVKTWESSFASFLAYYSDNKEATSGDPATLKIKAVNIKPIDDLSTAPTYTVDGWLQNFTVDMFSCIRLGFRELSFHAGNGKDTKVDVDLKWVAFAGSLSFVEKLRDFLEDLAGDLFKLDLEPTGIRASFTLPIPSIAVGVFSLRNISLGAGLDLPFTGDKPMLVNFAFCTRENPFVLSVGPFGGGGFLGITLSAAGVEILEASFEFGGTLALDVGVASGSIEAMAGVYFKYKSGEGSYLEGYLKLKGELSILELISVSAMLYLSFSYQSQGNKVWGQATLEVEVDILFISIPVSVHVEKQFSGSDDDPPFSVMMSEKQWHEYEEAFGWGEGGVA